MPEQLQFTLTFDLAAPAPVATSMGKELRMKGVIRYEAFVRFKHSKKSKT
jgi:hypothetical protein